MLKIPDQRTLTERLEAHKTQLLALPEEKLQRPRIPFERAVTLAQELLEGMKPLMPQVHTTFSPAKAAMIQKAFEQLPTHLFVFIAAAQASADPWKQQQKKRFQYLAQKIRHDDALYMNFCRAMFLNDAETYAKLDEIQSGRGHLDDAQDVLELCKILLSSPKITLPTTLFSEQDLRQSERDALEFLVLVQGRRDAQNPKGSPPDLWHRAFTLFHLSYSEVLRADRFILNDQGDDPSRLPALNNPTKPKKDLPEPSSPPTS